MKFAASLQAILVGAIVITIIAVIIAKSSATDSLIKSIGQALSSLIGVIQSPQNKGGP